MFLTVYAVTAIGSFLNSVFLIFCSCRKISQRFCFFLSVSTSTQRPLAEEPEGQKVRRQKRRRQRRQRHRRRRHQALRRSRLHRGHVLS